MEAVAYTYVFDSRSAQLHTNAMGSFYRPKRLLEQIKGISEQKATKVLVEGKPTFQPAVFVAGMNQDD